MTLDILKLHTQISAVCPIDGVSVGAVENKSTWSIQFRPEATEQEKAAADAVIDAFDLSAPIVPRSVTPYQARQALNAAGLRAAAEAAIASAPQEIQDAWEYALTIERNSPFIAAVSGALGLSDQQIDALFVTAAST